MHLAEFCEGAILLRRDAGVGKRADGGNGVGLVGAVGWLPRDVLLERGVDQVCE
jgi:hypothetical protein